MAAEVAQPIGIAKPLTVVPEVQARAEETHRLVLMHSGARWGGGGGAQRPQQLAYHLAKQAAVVHLSWGNRGRPRVVDGVAVERSFQWRRYAPIAEAGDIYRPVFYTGIPSHTGLTMAQAARDRNWFVIYDCMDEWQYLPGAVEWYDEEFERGILQAADLVLYTASSLADHVREIGVPRTTCLEHLPNSTLLANEEWAAERTVDCVFAGTIMEAWVDFDLLQRVAQEYTLLMVGALDDDKPPFEHPNVSWTGLVPWRDLMGLLSTARVGLIPFLDIPLCRAVDPIKFYDYTAAGLYSIASHLPELDNRPYATNTFSQEEFLAAIERILNAEEIQSSTCRAYQRHYARDHYTAAHRAARLVEILKEEDAW